MSNEYKDLGEITHSGRRKTALKVAESATDPRKFRYNTKTYFPKFRGVHFDFFTHKKLTKKEAMDRILRNEHFANYAKENTIEVLKKYMTT